ncbi:MAG: HDOD domain-containing protein [Chitinophagales bacterium]
MISIEQIVAEVDDLPSLPHVTIQVAKLANDPNSVAQDIGQVIMQDQSLTTKVLRLANSAYYGFPRRISTVTEATVLLGFNTIKSIVMAASVNDIMSSEIQGYALPRGELWRHSQAGAFTASFIAKKAKFRSPDLAYTGALLHDIGKVILNHYLEKTYHDVVDLIHNEKIDFSEAERRVLGFTHAEVGAKVAEQWNLPEELVEAIEFHHEPAKASLNPRLTAIVHLADAICMTMGIGLGIDGLCYMFDEKALSILNIEANDMDSIIAHLSDMFSDENGFLL